MADEKNRVGILPGLALLFSLLALLLVGVLGIKGPCGTSEASQSGDESVSQVRGIEERIGALEAGQARAKAMRAAQARIHLSAIASDLPDDVRPHLDAVFSALAALEQDAAVVPPSPPAVVEQPPAD